MDDLATFLNARIETVKANFESEVKLILMDTGDKAVKMINEYIDMWYEDYHPIAYERTDELRDCARYSIEGNKIKIYMDMRRIKSSMENNGNGWQAHRGFDGEDFTYGLIDFLENGGQNGARGSLHNPRRNDFGIHFLKDTQEWVNEYVNKQVEIKINALVRQNYKQ